MLAALSLLVSTSITAQSWIDFGIKGGYGPNLFVNSNYFNDGKFNQELDFGYTLGAKLGYNINEMHEVCFEVLTSEFNQNFNYNLTDEEGTVGFYQKSLSYNTFDISMTYRNNKDGKYVEIGPQYSIVNRATGTDNSPDAWNGSIEDKLAKNHTSLVFGFGSYFAGTENFGVILGFRGTYAISDVLSEEGKAQNYPANKAYGEYKASHPLAAMIVIELNYDLAYLASAKCHRKKLLFFK